MHSLDCEIQHYGPCLLCVLTTAGWFLCFIQRHTATIRSVYSKMLCFGACKSGGDVTTRHNTLHNAVHSTFQRAGLSAHLEVGCGWGKDNART